MAYKQKIKQKKEINSKAIKLRTLYLALDNEAYIKYGSKFSELTKKEQEEISKIEAKRYKFYF